MWPACVPQKKSVCSCLIMNEPSNPVHLYICVCGCRMIHLAVLLPAALSSNLIRRDRERESIFFTSSPSVVYESTNCLFDCLNKWHKANECELTWSGCRPYCTSMNHPHSSHSVCFSSSCLWNSDAMHFIFHLRGNKTARPIEKPDKDLFSSQVRCH